MKQWGYGSVQPMLLVENTVQSQSRDIGHKAFLQHQQKLSSLFKALWSSVTTRFFWGKMGTYVQLPGHQRTLQGGISAVRPSTKR